MDRRWLVVQIATLEAIHNTLQIPYDTFILLLALDGRGLSDRELRDGAVGLLRAGARCICAWGPDCERVHDAFDGAALELGFNNESGVIMTTWHDEESLKEATWFAANSAFPDAKYAAADDALLALSIGSREWEAEIRGYLQAGTPIEDEA